MPNLRRRLITLLKLALIALVIFILAGAGLIIYLAFDHNAPLDLPAPTGPYAVGRAEMDWVEAGRPDPLVGQGSALRELVVWVWYPAGGGGASPAPYLPPAWVQARGADQGLGVLIEKDLNKIRTHAFEGVPLAAQPALFPLLVMQPGMGPMASDYTVFAENLASHGYVVVGINPTYTANWTVFPDGRFAPRSALGTIPDSDTPAQTEADAIRIEAVWVQDATFAMDQLANMNADPASFFHQRLDLDHIGLWGHSFGGATALAVCQHDPRCQAGVDLDGSPWGEEKQAALTAPFMIMTEDSGQACDANCALLRQVLQHTLPGTGYLVSLAGAGHFNFSDLPLRQEPLVRPLFALAGYEGAIPPTRALEITNAYLVAFFDQYLKGKPQPLLQGPPASYPEVTSFEKH
jgi:predicted dienelactone hydrolase